MCIDGDARRRSESKKRGSAGSLVRDLELTAKKLGVENEKHMGLGGRLSVRIQHAVAEGHPEARAFYDSDSRTIHIEPTATAPTTFAHEWGHALDHLSAGVSSMPNKEELSSVKAHERTVWSIALPSEALQARIAPKYSSAQVKSNNALSVAFANLDQKSLSAKASYCQKALDEQNMRKSKKEPKLQEGY